MLLDRKNLFIAIALLVVLTACFILYLLSFNPTNNPRIYRLQTKLITGNELQPVEVETKEEYTLKYQIKEGARPLEPDNRYEWISENILEITGILVSPALQKNGGYSFLVKTNDLNENPVIVEVYLEDQLTLSLFLEDGFYPNKQKWIAMPPEIIATELRPGKQIIIAIETSRKLSLAQNERVGPVKRITIPIESND